MDKAQPQPLTVSSVDFTVSDLEIPRLSQLQHQFILSSNSNPAQTHVTLDNAAVVATKHDTTSRARKILTAGFTKATAEWRAVAMSGTVYRDFTMQSTGNHDADIAAMAFEMARQRLTAADMVEALRGIQNPKQITEFDLNHVVDGRAVAYTRVDTKRDAPDSAAPMAVV
jgi:hypothetical protein